MAVTGTLYKPNDSLDSLMELLKLLINNGLFRCNDEHERSTVCLYLCTNVSECRVGP